MGLYQRGRGRHIPVVGAVVAVVLVAMWPYAVGPANAAGSSSVSATSTSTTTTTTLPPVATVPLSVTDGQSAATLLSRAITLASVGVDTSALEAGLAVTEQNLDEDAVTARQMSSAASAADHRAAAARAQAAAADANYQSLDGALKAAVLFLYTSGPTNLSVNPDAGGDLAYAADYADTAITPNGLLSVRRYDVGLERQDLATAKKAQTAADRAATKAAHALAEEAGQRTRLQAELSSVSKASASEVAADHLSLAAQASAELVSASGLQFTSKTPIPAPLSTTAVALSWAFAELGKPYVWGATGPDSFDCSGLTQFVWRAAGVSIPRVAADQDAWTIPVPLSQLLPGDLVFYGETDIHHVGIYLGDGLMINAPHTGTVVQVSSIWWSDLAGFGRVHAPGTPIPLHEPPSTTRPATPIVVATAGPVPSQRKAPPGWKPQPGSSTPFEVYAGPGPTTTTTTVPATSTTTVLDTTTTTVDATGTTTTSTTSTTTLPAAEVPSANGAGG